MQKNNKEFVPIYQMNWDEYYLLLRIQMSKEGYNSVSGVDDRFYREETFQNTEHLMKGLEKKGFLQRSGDQISVSEGLLEALKDIVESSHCLVFKNGLLERVGGIIAFYYSNGKYCGVLRQDKAVTLVCNKNEEAVYSVFQKGLEADGISDHFSHENWKKLWYASNLSKELDKPVRSAVLVHTGNRKGRNAFSIDMLCDKKNIQMLRHFADSKIDEMERGFLPIALWHNIIIAEMKRLKEEHNYRQGIKEAEQKPKIKSDYQMIVESPNFPQSRIGFAGWTLKRFIMGIPGLIKSLIKKKFISAILMVLWAAVLFVYNMYITCYFNDTFMLDRRARLGNLSPYLMGATLRTPCDLKGFDLNLGLINTTFLVAPLFAVLTFLARQLFTQIRNRKKNFLWDLFAVAGTAQGNRKAGYGKGRDAWIALAAAFGVGFLLMNPLTLFLTAFLALLIFIEGRDNNFVQYLMLYSCAASRKKVERGEKREPDFRRISMAFFNFGCGMLLYAVVSLGLWFGMDYRFWARLLVTILLIGFCVLQIVLQQSGRKLGKTGKTALLLVAVFAAASYFSMKYGIVLADDGGISESGGTLAGLMRNAGFSTILGISITTLGIAVGGPVAWMIAAGAIVGGGTFLTGLTDTKAGAYVNKSANQFFNGVPEGENKTLLCTGTELLSFVSSFVNPTAGMSSLGVKTIYAGKLATDAISLTNDVATVADDIGKVLNGECGIGTLAWDALGMGLDIYGANSDINDAFDEFSKIASRGDAYRYVDGPDFGETMEQLRTEQANRISTSDASFNSARDTAIRTESDNFAREYSNYNEEIRKLNSGETAPIPGMTKEQSIQKYQDYIAEAQTNYNNKVADITAQYQRQAEEARQAISAEYWQKQAAEYTKQGIDWTSKGYATKSEADKLKDFYDTNWGEKAPATGTSSTGTSPTKVPATGTSPTKVPSSGASTAETPVTKEPVTETPTAQTPTAKEPVTETPATETPTVETQKPEVEETAEIEEPTEEPIEELGKERENSVDGEDMDYSDY